MNNADKKLLKECAEQSKIHAERAAARTVSNHTPGPWAAGGTTVYGSAKGSCRNTVASTVCCGSLTKDEDEANARLIATAPELLETLKKAKTLVDILVKLYPDGHEHDLSFKLADGTFSDCIWCDAVKAKVNIIKAIAKAEGGK
jgi:hypothetical protein